MAGHSVAEPAFEVNGLYFTSMIPWRSAQTPRILIIEDDLDVQQGWSLFLRHQGYEVCAADNGTTGLELIEAEEPDIVLLDLALPGMHGFKILHEVRMRGLPVQVVVASGAVSAETERRALGQGASLVIPKPVNMHGLVSVIEQLLLG